ncbi:MAG: hypothetical protein ACHQ2Z_02120 [Elusimicrobiota bacterium]
MIGRAYAKYVDWISADRGVLAFFKWFVAGILLQVVFMLPAIPLLAAAAIIEGDAGKYLAVTGFLTAFAAARVFLFALPCASVAERKGLGPRFTWGAGGFVFGQIALGLVAALPPRSAEAPRP